MTDLASKRHRHRTLRILTRFVMSAGERRATQLKRRSFFAWRGLLYQTMHQVVARHHVQRTLQAWRGLWSERMQSLVQSIDQFRASIACKNAAGVAQFAKPADENMSARRNTACTRRCKLAPFTQENHATPGVQAHGQAPHAEQTTSVACSAITAGSVARAQHPPRNASTAHPHAAAPPDARLATALCPCTPALFSCALATGRWCATT